ncbi:MAG: tRNA preQ1(34) S-adenosylmethionine ribosyltransferase-isomerase QueA [Clostridia bacterium]|nr:tRNA preQ1(34) S-adenosylmethionine ribosyltransferase-isomerase QueA [Clostridia bacterium]
MIKNELPKTDLTLRDFHYDLPEELIAQTPLERRDASRLMVIDRASGEISHRHFYDIVDCLMPGDTLVINDTRVIPARIIGHRRHRYENGALVETGSTAPVELLLLKQLENDVWEALAGPGKRAKRGDVIMFGDGSLTARVTDVLDEGGIRKVKFAPDKDKFDSVYSALHALGTMPLPPYIKEKLEDGERYQTVYSRCEGSSAAPTAGLHFTNELLDRIKEAGVAVVPVLLHVGLGTFRPVKEEHIEDHEMHAEYIEVTEEAADVINRRRAAGGRIIAVGTTSCRTLESASGEDGKVRPVKGDTGIFIYPGYRFKATDALITNFHLPESTLLMLVSAFYSREKMLEAYKTAVEEKYRFFSFGDAMLIV